MNKIQEIYKPNFFYIHSRYWKLTSSHHFPSHSPHFPCHCCTKKATHPHFILSISSIDGQNETSKSSWILYVLFHELKPF